MTFTGMNNQLFNSYTLYNQNPINGVNQNFQTAQSVSQLPGSIFEAGMNIINSGYNSAPAMGSYNNFSPVNTGFNNMNSCFPPMNINILQQMMNLIQFIMQSVLQCNYNNNYTNNNYNNGQVNSFNPGITSNYYNQPQISNNNYVQGSTPLQQINYPQQVSGISPTYQAGVIPQDSYNNEVGEKAAQIALHESTLGIKESNGSYLKYGQEGHWCAAFADWCLTEAYGKTPPWKMHTRSKMFFHSVPRIVKWAKENKVYKAYDPNTVYQDVKVGDMIIFQREPNKPVEPGRRRYSRHVGVVVSINPDGSIDTVEGNVHNKCVKKHYRAGDPKIQGFMQVHRLPK